MTSDLTPIQHLVVKACLAPSRDAQLRWVSEWEERVVIDDLDYSSSRLIPYLLHKNQQEGISTRHDKRLKVIFKHWWLKTQHINDQLDKVLALLTASKIEHMVIKGATTRNYYKQPALRTMGDFDLLVRPADLQHTIDLLREIGYIPNQRSEACIRRAPQLTIDFMHAMDCAHELLDTRIDVHWRIGSYCSMDFTEKLWANAEKYDLQHPGTKKPRLAYEAFIILLHAVMNRSHDNLNWIIDMSVLNDISGGAFWPEVRQLFRDEKKEDIFDYACSILPEYEVHAPVPAIPAKPPRLTLINEKKKTEMSLPGLVYTKFVNHHFKVSQLYPHAGPFTLLYQYLRRARFYLVLARLPEGAD